jgi:hypothetical protein
MRRVNFTAGRSLFLLVSIASYVPLVGCSDDSKTSGTMVQVSEEEKEHLKTKRAAYKAARPSTKPAKSASPVTGRRR